MTERETNCVKWAEVGDAGGQLDGAHEKPNEEHLLQRRERFRRQGQQAPARMRLRVLLGPNTR